MSAKEIASAITALPANEVAELVAWLKEHHQDIWDKQIEDDLEADRLDALLAEVEQEYRAGLARPL